MSNKVEVIASHPIDGHEVNERWEEDPVRAKAIVSSGHARYATKAAAKKAAGTTAKKTTAKSTRTPKTSPAGESGS